MVSKTTGIVTVTGDPNENATNEEAITITVSADAYGVSKVIKVNIIRDFTTDENITKTLSKAKNIETQNIIINISNSPINEPKIKWCNILCSLVESTISGLGSLFIKNTLK